MTEPSRKVRKGHGISPPAEVISIEAQDSLYFMTLHPIKPGHVDLSIFATGATIEDCPTGHRKTFIPFSGRPSLIRELAPEIRHFYSVSPHTTVEALMGTLRWWWRLLDRCADVAPVTSVRDLNDIHYATYRAAPSPDSVAQKFFQLVKRARESRNLAPLYWTSIAPPEKTVDLIPYHDVKRIYHYVKRPAFDALHRFEQSPNDTPTGIDILRLFTLFVLATGWNAATALDIDVSVQDGHGSLKCIIPHPQNEEFCYVRSKKARAGGSVQYALSRKKSQISPSNIVIALYQQTQPLRARLTRYLNILKWQLNRWERQGGKSILEINNRRILIAAVARQIKSPWLYARSNVPEGGRQHLPVADIAVLHKYTMHAGRNKLRSPLVVWARQINDNLRPGERPVAEDIKLTDLRDAYVSWRWERSGYSWLDAMLAAGHKNLETLQRYLNKKQHKAASRRDFLKVGDALWDTITCLGGVGASSSLSTVVAAKVAGASDKQLVRWLSSKDQTYVGTGCADFYNPPDQYARNHRMGDGCRFQRCTLCEHAILLPESYHHLAKRRVELASIKSSISSTSWLESDYPAELQNTEVALSTYDEPNVASSIAYWESEMKNGKHAALWLEGAYA